MNSVFSFVVGLLTAALSLLGFVQQHPELPQASRDQANQIAQQAITQATQALSTQSGQQTTVQTNTGSLSVSPLNGQAPLTVTFSILQSAGGQFIDFGDGTNPCSPLIPGFVKDEGGCNAPAYPQTFTHTYTSPGAYHVTASRLLPSSRLGSATVTVTGASQVRTSIPSTNANTNGVLTVSTLSGSAPLTVTVSWSDLHAAGYGDFGDFAQWNCSENLCAAGSTTHVYTKPGTYIVHMYRYASRASETDTVVGSASITVN